MKKRGQSQVFTYIIVVLIIGAVILFGYSGIRRVIEAKNQAELITFESSMESDLESIASQYGDVNFRDYRFPSDIGEVIFVDLDTNSKDAVSAWLSTNYPIIADKINSGIEDDIYLFDDDGNFLKSMDIGELSIAGPGWIAYKNDNGRFRVKYEGRGGGKAQIGGDFVRVADLEEGETTRIVIEEIEDLELELKLTSPADFKGTVKLIITKAEEGEGITDNIDIEILDSDGNEPGPMIFEDSYIQIPINVMCIQVDTWAGYPKSECQNEIFVRYNLDSIP